MATFTMEEMIQEKGLGVSLTDPTATRLIAKRLKEMGYQQVRLVYKGKRQMVWTNERSVHLEDLKSKLADLKL